ncbi:hypothetical protein PAXRUDRAFT_17865 [Paxillus rubicundulus Ve08.2h10]|uniref:Uncharacterized protein n=1 Tax=Paxillus rubicundulus Ve08.2h10 TaxID=930991 RepID=A0A0D0D923_9AGAM|nr:hypothetical protein PAXRUDRAFT_17865 [Paxillus rubicundulus Ve08.2h10]
MDSKRALKLQAGPPGGRAEPSPPPNPPPNPPIRQRILYNQRRPPPFDLEALVQATVLSKLREAMDYVLLVKNAVLEDLIAQLDNNMLGRIRNPPQGPLQIDSPGIHHSITTYLALEHASQEAYKHVIHSTRQSYPTPDRVDNELLSFKVVEKLIASYTGIDPIWHDMCPDSCVGFTGPFKDLDDCPTCNKSQWNEAKLHVSNGCIKVSLKKFPTIPLGPQLQALYRDPKSAQFIDNITMGWDYLGMVLDSNIKENDIMVMASLDGAQLYEDKDSNCWIYVWIIVNLSPDKWYRKVHVLPGGFIPGPNKPKNLDSFLVVGIHHLAALQKEGLKVWNASQNEVFLFSDPTFTSSS